LLTIIFRRFSPVEKLSGRSQFYNHHLWSETSSIEKIRSPKTFQWYWSSLVWRQAVFLSDRMANSICSATILNQKK
jgi:hypothetical protein